MLQCLKIKSCNNNGNRVSIFFSILLCVFPLFSLIPMMEPFIYGLTIASGFLAFFLGGMLLLKSKSISYIPLSPLFIVFLLFLGYGLLSAIIRGNKFVILPLLNILFFIFIILNCLPQLMHFEEKFSRISAYLLFPYLFYVWSVSLGGGEWLIFGHSHFCGTWLLVFLPIQIYAFHHSKNRFERFFFAFLSVVNLLWIVFFSDSVALSFLGVLCFLSGWLPVWSTRYFYRAGAAVFLFFLSWGGMFHSSILHSLSDRLSIWKLIAEHWRQVLFFGKGVGSFEAFYSKLLTAWLVLNPQDYRGSMSLPVEWAHNEMVQFFVELGLPGLFLLLGFSFFFLKEVYLRFKRSDSSLFFYSGLVLMFFYSFLSFPFRMPATGLLCLFLFTVFCGRTASGELVGIRWKNRLPSAFLTLEIFVVVLILFFIVLYQNTASYYFYSRAFQDDHPGLNDLKFAQKAVDYNPYSKIYQYGLAKKYLDYHDFFKAEYHFKQSGTYAYSWAVLFGWAVALDYMGRGEKARDLYEKIKKTAPDFEPAQINQNILLQRFESLNKRKINIIRLQQTMHDIQAG